MKKIEIPTGATFWWLTAIKDGGGSKWVYKCVCGKKVVAPKYLVTKGKIKSCGCYADSIRGKGNKKHGMSGTKVHRAWMHMRNRCTNKKGDRYHRYGGRGLRVCKEWALSFEAFYRDMGAPPSNRHSLGRIDNNAGYNKSNCRWETPAVQAQNTCRTKLSPEIVKKIRSNKHKSLKQWASELNVSVGTIKSAALFQTWKDI